MPIMVMKLRSFWERHRARRWASTAGARLPVAAKTPKPFQPLAYAESIAVLVDAIPWLVDETRTTLAMPNSPSKERRWAELRARDRSMARDFERLVSEWI